MPLATPYISRELSRAVPFASPNEFQGSLGIGASVSFSWDVLIAVADRNLVGAPGGYAAGARHAVGPLLDGFVFGAGATSLVVEYGLGIGAAYRNFSTTAIPGGTPTNLSGLRITARFVRITLTNTSGAANTVEFGGYVRST